MSDMMKYKVGDKVRVRHWNDMAKEFFLNKAGSITNLITNEVFSKSMEDLCGTELEILRVNRLNYTCKGNIWNWQDWMFEDKPAYTQDVLDVIEQLNNIYMPEIFRSKSEERVRENVSVPEPLEPSIEVILANAKLLLKRLGYTVVSDENLLRILTQPVKVKPMLLPIHQDDSLIVLPSAAEVFASIRPRLKETKDEE